MTIINLTYLTHLSPYGHKSLLIINIFTFPFIIIPNFTYVETLIVMMGVIYLLHVNSKWFSHREIVFSFFFFPSHSNSSHSHLIQVFAQIPIEVLRVHSLSSFCFLLILLQTLKVLLNYSSFHLVIQGFSSYYFFVHNCLNFMVLHLMLLLTTHRCVSYLPDSPIASFLNT